MVEAALVLITLLSMILFILDMGRILLLQQFITERAREGARYAVVNNWNRRGHQQRRRQRELYCASADDLTLVLRIQRRTVSRRDARGRRIDRTNDFVSETDDAGETRRDDRAVCQWIRPYDDCHDQRIHNAVRKSVTVAGGNGRRHEGHRAVRGTGCARRVSIQHSGAIQPRKRRPIDHGHLWRPDHASWNVNHDPKLRAKARYVRLRSG